MQPSVKAGLIKEGDIHIVQFNEPAIELSLGVINKHIVPVGHIDILQKYPQGPAAPQSHKEHPVFVELGVPEHLLVGCVVGGRVALDLDGASAIGYVLLDDLEAGEGILEGVMCAPLDVLLQVAQGQVLQLALVGQPEVVGQKGY